MTKEQIIELIRQAFSETDHPGDGFLQRSREGEDAFEAVTPFRGFTDWSMVDAGTLDEHYDALSFLSEGGFRFFLPAYLIADLNDQLRTADPVFHLAGAFRDAAVSIPVAETVFEKRIGKSALLNPRRFGAMTFEDYARFRLSVFTRHEAAAIVAYLEYRRELPDAVDGEDIDAALDLYWRDRAATAPTTADLADHLQAEADFMQRVSDAPHEEDPG
ncbi:MAG: hypothetical protein HKN80_12045 [Acidimicrobiia bacterium]|nr:hypothetical protein [Acidimicrobiia bacterium]